MQFWNRLKERAPRAVLFYLLGFYVLLQFGWWAYMLVDLNSEIYELRLQLLQASEVAAPEQLILKAELDQKLSLRIWMVLGEGAVFVCILLLGFWAVRKSIIKELQLAEQQRNFLLSVTHELKSPLAAVKLHLQTLNTRELPADKRELLYGRALKDTNRLEKLVENLLLVNKVESGKLPLDKQPIDFAKLVEIVLDEQFSNERSAGRINFISTSNINVNGDEMALQSVAANLIENALKYGGETKVDIGLKVDNGQVVLRVADGGNGIPNSEKQKVFERFYRIGNEDVRKTKGTGIGLYLVKLLVENHRGQIRVEDNQPKGSVFVVTLPIDVG